MLIEFKVKNFLSFKDLVTFSMVCMKSFKEHQENTFVTSHQLKLLKTAAIYGNNGSGKSNLLKAFSFFKSFIINSYRDALLDEDTQQIPIHKFAFSTLSDTIPVYFEVSFVIEDIIYRYGFEVEHDRVCKEWLYQTTTKEVPLFIRNEEGINYVNHTSFQEGLLVKQIKSNVLLLTKIAHDGGVITDKLIAWLKKMSLINGMYDIPYRNFTIKKLKEDQEFTIWLGQFMAFLEVSQVSVVEKSAEEVNINKLKNSETDEDLINLLISVQKLQLKQPKEQVLMWHHKYDANNFIIDSVGLDLDRAESSGTRKLFYLLGFWYEALKMGRILIIDELDAQLHSNLVEYLIQFFHKSNEKNAQLIFVTHNSVLLNKDIFRRDQFWFLEKNQFGASALYSLGDFSSEQVRNKSAFDKNYLNGKYGAVPYFEKTEKLISLLYDKKE